MPEWLSPAKPVVELEMMGAAYAHDSAQEASDGYGQAELRLTLDGMLADTLQYRLVPVLRADTASRSGWGPLLLENGYQRSHVSLEEATLAYYGDSFEVVAGKQFFNWGTGDTFRPTDVLNPMDNLDIPTAAKLAVPAISLFHYGEVFDTQIVLVPWFTPDRNPGDGNRWKVSDTAELERIAAAFGTDPLVIDHGRDLPANSLENAQIAVRLSSSVLVDGWDLAIMGYRGFDTNGVVATRFTPPSIAQPVPVVELETEFPEILVFGGSVSTVVRDYYEVHGELTHTNTLDQQMDDDYMQYVVGVTRRYDDILPDLFTEVRVTLDYAGEIITAGRESGSRYRDNGFSRGLRNTLLSEVKLKFSEDTDLTVGGALGLIDYDYLGQITFTHSFSSSLSMSAGLEVFEGPASSFFGSWDSNDRATLTITYIY